jgi:hypothetical protein
LGCSGRRSLQLTHCLVSPDGQDMEQGPEDVELGFAETETNEWQLALRWARYRTVDQRLTLTRVRETKRLLDCSRNERIEALKRLPALVARIKEKASEAVKAIEAAKRLLK